MPTEKHKRARQKKRRKDKEKLFRSSKSICNDCGFIGKPEKVKKGSWAMYFLKFSVVVPVATIVITLSMVEGVLRMAAFTRPYSVIWHIGFEQFFPHLPHYLLSCPKCGHGNSMKGLRTQKGQHIYERFERSHFLGY